ncbi:hypothetical protein RvY_19058 [Ramazzottius varieornatus]|uniref:CSC1/OSCA1-like cytosolic domain-containing protein n=1 Tax=Ramazzottius varieornatus TaxID=947166 RepID=A0A1D1W9E1_RAMVA|nr:hypothetical protein RvY_19058 [Ramazzottius varieornatus]
MSLIGAIVKQRERIGNPGYERATARSPATQCDTIRQEDGSWITAHLGPHDNGIWLNLTVCGVVFALALAVFILLKKKVFNQADVPPSYEECANGRGPNNIRAGIGTAIYGQRNVARSAEDDIESRRQRWYSRLTHALSESDYELLTRGGLGALEYVRFQRYVLLFTVFLAIMSLCIILPVNLTGTLYSDNVGRMTLSNVDPRSTKLWFTVLMTIVLFPMGIAAMRSFGLQATRTNGTRNHRSRSVMFSGLNPKRANAETIASHFREAYPGYTVEDVALSYDVRHLSHIGKELNNVEEALKYCAGQASGADMNITLGGCCGCYGTETNAEKYYLLRKSELEQKLDQEVSRWKTINPVFFVTFATEHQAQQVHGDYQRCAYCLADRSRPQSIHSRDLDTDNWTAFAAPHPSSVNWDNLGKAGWTWYLRALVVNLLLLAIIAGLTSAVIALNYLSLPVLQQTLDQYPGVSQVLPALVLLAMQKVVPQLIIWGVEWMGYWSKPKQMIAQMRLMFTDLVLAVVVIPGVGLVVATAHVFLGDLSGYRRQCVNLPDNGSVYIHYLIFFAFIGTAMSLFRVNVLFDYCVRSCRARSKAEEAIASRVDRAFDFGEEYANFLTAFTVIVVYSFINPMISLIGVIALMMKYLLDQYMLCNVYRRTAVPNSVHSVAISQFLFAIILQLIWILLIFILRNGLDIYSISLSVTFVIWGTMYFTMTLTGAWEKISIFEMMAPRGDSDPFDGAIELGDMTYTPPVLRRQRRPTQVQNEPTVSTQPTV